MDSLISQFFDAIQNWSEKTDFPEDDLRLYILDRVGPSVDWRDVEMELATIQDRVEYLVHSIGISEKFLIVALIQAIDKVFVLQIADLAQGENASEVRRVREVRKKWLEEASEQERQSTGFQRKMKWQDEIERRIMPSPEKIQYREFLLATWREVMAPILALDSQPDMPNLPRKFP